MKPLAFRSFLEDNRNFRYEGGVFLQAGFQPDDFEREYISLRRDEGRLIDPSKDLCRAHPVLSKEWKVRIRSAKRFIGFLRNRSTKNVLEVGCGNGWLVRMIHSDLQIDCCGVERNRTEIMAAVQVESPEPQLTFAVGNILSPMFPENCVDIILLAASIQYFQDLPGLIASLRKYLLPNGEIHILDSPLYNGDEIEAARKRSFAYFTGIRHPEMAKYYFHHSWESLAGINTTVLHDPDAWQQKILRSVTAASPFPWIRITHTA